MKKSIVSAALSISTCTPPDTNLTSDTEIPESSGSMESSVPTTSAEVSSTATGGPGTTTSSSEGTTADTPPPGCNDGMLDEGEECDRGEDNEEMDEYADMAPPDPLNPPCTKECKTVKWCGDEKLFPGKEECDKGEANDGDVEYLETAPDDTANPPCTTTCKVVKWCGNGMLEVEEEECDSGADNKQQDEYTETPPEDPKNPPCTTMCKAVKWCGDGEIFPDKEECDDANATDEDTCSIDCYSPRLIFVTSIKYQGNLGGVTGADAKCRDLAMSLNSVVPANAEQGLQWFAWLGAEGVSPSSQGRIKDDNWGGWYQMKCTGRGDQIATKQISQGWSGLTLMMGNLKNAVDCDEMGLSSAGVDLTQTPSVARWTNVTPAGMIGNFSCTNWTDNSNGVTGEVGIASKATSEWTQGQDQDGFRPCGGSHRLYCVQGRMLTRP